MTTDESHKLIIGELVEPFFPAWVVVIGADHICEHGTFVLGKGLWLLMPIVIDEVLLGVISGFGDVAIVLNVKVSHDEGVGKEFLGFAVSRKSTFLKGWVFWERLFEVSTAHVVETDGVAHWEGAEEVIFRELVDDFVSGIAVISELDAAFLNGEFLGFDGLVGVLHKENFVIALIELITFEAVSVGVGVIVISEVLEVEAEGDGLLIAWLKHIGLAESA